MRLVFATLIAADAATSILGFALGGVEANPLGFVPAITVKVMACALALRLVRDYPTVRWTLGAVVVALAMPVIWNARQLLP